MNGTNTWQEKIRRTFAYSSVAGPILVLVVVFILLCFVPKFFALRSVTGIINAATLSGMLAIGVTMLMISGEFDLSVGSVMAVGGYLFSYFCTNGNPLLGLILGLLVPALLGVVNGLILVWTNIPSFIVTLGTKYFFRGLLWIVSGGAMIQTIDKLGIYNVFNGRLDFINDIFKGANFRTSIFWLIGIALIIHYVLTRTAYGNHVFAVGGNTGAARGQGVNVKRVKVVNFALNGLLAGFTGILLFSQYATVQVASGDGMELSAIAAAVVGGTLITGGYGNIWGALIGGLTISTLRTGVVLMDIPFIPADNFEAVVGVTIVLAVILNNWLRKRA